jgi:hypothetical protein
VLLFPISFCSLAIQRRNNADSALEVFVQMVLASNLTRSVSRRPNGS